MFFVRRHLSISHRSFVLSPKYSVWSPSIKRKRVERIRKRSSREEGEGDSSVLIRLSSSFFCFF